MTKPYSLAGTVAFSLLMTFSSGLGQTFFISLFNEELRTAFALSHGQIGSLYFIGTLSSALMIIWAGKLLDIVDIRLYTLAVCIGLATACFAMSRASGTISLIVAFFLLRLFGQGLSGHTGITTASRSPQQYRGRVISLSGLGFSLSEMILPIATVWLLSIWHWRDIWSLYAAIELVAVVLLSQFLLARFHISRRGSIESAVHADDDSWQRRDVTRDLRFWLIAPAIFAPSIVSTGLFFHQQSLSQSKGFSITVWASAIAAYSIAAVSTSLLTGLAVDRWSGATVVRGLLLPFICALLFAATVQSSWLPFIYYALMGMTVGIATPAVNALWVELYGSTHIAAIRSLAHALMVFGSALGPVMFGMLLDNGFSWNFILTSSACWMIAASLLLCLTPLTRTARQSTSPS
jgi:MFS family permease